MPIIDGESRCLKCKENKTASYEEWKGHGFFCSKECRDAWNLLNPDEDVFLERPVKSNKRYCDICHRLMRERHTIEKGQHWFCKKCNKEFT